MIEDWETGALYWSCLEEKEGNKEMTIESVREKYLHEFSKKDLLLFRAQREYIMVRLSIHLLSFVSFILR